MRPEKARGLPVRAMIKVLRAVLHTTEMGLLAAQKQVGSLNVSEVVEGMSKNVKLLIRALAEVFWRGPLEAEPAREQLRGEEGGSEQQQDEEDVLAGGTEGDAEDLAGVELVLDADADEKTVPKRRG